jgi:hypothetical protein
MKIAQGFNLGLAHNVDHSPEGTAEKVYEPFEAEFSPPFGTGRGFWHRTQP